MKFQCNRCQARYSIADEKVRGKVLKIRCKKCSDVITVRETDDREGTEPSYSTGSGRFDPLQPKERSVRSPALEGAFERAMVQGSSLLQNNEDDELRFDSQSKDATTVAASSMVPPSSEEWYLSVDGSQDGPFTLAEAQKRVGQKKPDDEMHAWREGFEGWRLVEGVSELKAHVPAAPLLSPPPRFDEPPVVPAAFSEDEPEPLSDSDLVEAQSDGQGDGVTDEPSGGAGRGSEFDFDIGEASRVVRMPILPPAGMGVAAPAEASVMKLPGVGKASGEKGPRGQAGGARAVVDVAALRAQAAAQGAAASSTLGPQVARKKRGVLLTAGAGFGVVAALALVIVFIFGSVTDDGRAGRASGSTLDLLSDWYSSGGFPGSRGPTPPGVQEGNRGTRDRGGQRPRPQPQPQPQP
ncbi:MAG: zinc-ribbon domain-containing protein, partial [Deltaproteobacteria bacterium]|nr:zinc-ribbon domain-containing protein [Deltaproteobacteria bacterium]